MSLWKKCLTQSAVVLAMAGPMVGTVSAVYATTDDAPVVTQVTAPETVNVTLHKLLYGEGIPNGYVGEDFQNTGLELDQYSQHAYKKDVYGDVGFTLYELSEEIVKAAGGAEQTPVEVAQKFADQIKAKKDAGEEGLPDGITEVVGETDVDENGQVTFENVVNNKNKFYLIVETKHSEMVKSPSAPMLIQLPITNATGNGYLDSVHLYPKNEVQTLTQTFLKHGQALDATESTPLPGINFKLFKGEPGDDNAEEISQELITDAEGKINIKGLTQGKYFLVEQETAGKVDGMAKVAETEGVARENVGEYLAGYNALEDDKNELTFEVKSDGSIDANPLIAEYINYARPKIDKEITNKNGNDNSFNRHSAVNFKLNTPIPQNIKDYGVFEMKDEVVAPSGKDVVDILENTVKVKIGETELTKNVDYMLKISEDKRGFDLDFAVADRGEGKKQVSQAFLDAVGTGGKSVEVTYDVIINGDTVNENLENKVTLTYSNQPDGKVKRYDNSTETFITYGAKFLKQGDGLFGTGAAADALAGAEFVILNAEGKYFAGYDKDNVNNQNEAATWVDSQENAHIFESGSDGTFEITGLAKGTYQLKEIKAPEGYQLPVNPITEFEVDEDSYTNPAAVKKITNTRKPDLPMTGSEKTVVILAVASTMALGAGVVYSRKEQDA